jgi:hypothetical protein
MSWIAALPWKRIIGLVVGAAPIVASVTDTAPPWVGVAGAGIVGLAVNAERIFAKRAKPSMFDVAAAREKVDRMGK